MKPMLKKILFVFFTLYYISIAQAKMIKTGMKAPHFTVKLLNDKQFTLNKNKPTVIWFFTPYCDYFGQQYSFMSKDCNLAAKKMSRSYQKYGDKYNWIGLSQHADSISMVTEYRSQHNINFSVAIDIAASISIQYGVMYSPTVVIINKGVVVYRAKAKLQDFEKKLNAIK